MIDENKTEKKRGRYVRDTYLVTAIIVAIVILMGAIISPFVWKESMDMKVNYNTQEIKILRVDIEKLKGIDVQVKNMNEKINSIYDYLLKRGDK